MNISFLEKQITLALSSTGENKRPLEGRKKTVFQAQRAEKRGEKAAHLKFLNEVDFWGWFLFL